MQDKLKFPLLGKSGQQKLLQQSNKILLLIFFFLLGALIYVLASGNFILKNTFTTKTSPRNKFADIINKTPVPTPIPTPTPSPTPKPLTFAEMNMLYGPCVHLPVLMYHRVQTKEKAEEEKQTSISIYTDFFEKQMQYLKDKGYSTVSMQDLVNFFDNGTKIPPKSILITFDDGYENFYTDAYPILQKLDFKATVFIPTGLMNNPGYLSWEQISSISNVLFANHTWSHKNVMTSVSEMQYEVSTADIQLTDHGLNSPKVFAYPYGLDTGASEKYLSSLDYKLAFTTLPGSNLCAKKRFSLPRIRIGNTILSQYGF